MKARRFAWAILACVQAQPVGANDFVVPDWLYPISIPSSAPSASAAADAARVGVPGSAETFTRGETRDLFAAPDWFPDAHRPMPEIVVRGRKPDVYACGYCHLPDGAGRPENATLAGLSAGYIVDQMAAFARGERRSAWTGPAYRPAALMVQVAGHVTVSEVAAAAAYFSSQSLLHPRAQVVETGRVPRTRVGPWIHVAMEHSGDEPLGTRLIEIPRSVERHELRDPRTPYVAFVPPGSLARGRILAIEGSQAAPACVACHGAGLRGDGPGPPLAGRSPTYLLRQLVAFRTRARNSAASASMHPVADALTLEDMIAAAAYAASLPP